MDGLIESLVSLINDFDGAAIFPDLNTVLGRIELFARLFVLAAPIIILVLGLCYRFKPAPEANHSVGYRCYYGMGSVEAWRFTQNLAGRLWTLLGSALTLVMLIVTLTFGGKNAMQIVSAALTWIIIELVLIGGSCIAINVMVAMRYDKDGYPK